MSKQTASVPHSGVPELATNAHIQRHSGPKRFNLSSIGAMMFFIVCSIYFLIPFFWLVVSATKNGRDMATTFGLWFAPHFNLFTNLQFLFTYDDSIYVRWMLNTLISE